MSNLFPIPAANPMPAPKAEENRLLRRQIREWGKQFALRLKANAGWMKRFLHRDE